MIQSRQDMHPKNWNYALKLKIDTPKINWGIEDGIRSLSWKFELNRTRNRFLKSNEVWETECTVFEKSHEINIHTKFSSTWFAGLSIVSSCFYSFWSFREYEIKFHTTGFEGKSMNFFAYENFFFYSTMKKPNGKTLNFQKKKKKKQLRRNKKKARWAVSGACLQVTLSSGRESVFEGEQYPFMPSRKMLPRHQTADVRWRPDDCLRPGLFQKELMV